MFGYRAVWAPGLYRDRGVWAGPAWARGVWAGPARARGVLAGPARARGVWAGPARARGVWGQGCMGTWTVCGQDSESTD